MSVDHHIVLKGEVAPEVMLENIAICLPKPLADPDPWSNGLGLPLYDSSGFGQHASELHHRR